MARITFRRDGADERVEPLRLFAVRYLGEDEGLHRYQLDLRASFDFLKLASDVRKFRDMSVDAIVGDVLSKNGIAHRFELAEPLPSRPNTIQYRETSFDFTSRLLEHEGVHYSIEDDAIVFNDRSSAAPRVAGRDIFDLPEADGALAADDVSLTSFRLGTRIGSGRATVNDYNWKKPATSLLASQAGQRDTQLEVYEYLVGYRESGAGKRIAKLRVEAYESTKRFAQGTGTAVQFRPRRIFSFEHVDGISHAGEYLLVSVSHRFIRDGAGGARATYFNQFRCIPAEVPFRPPLSAPIPEVSGTHTAMVRGPTGEEIHTDELGRFKAQFHWDREAKGTDEDSRWLRMLQETSSSMGLARVGWEVSVGYIGGDPDRPVGLSRMINGQMVPSYGQPSRQNVMTIRTETYPGKAGFNEIRIDDTVGAQQIYVHAQATTQSSVKNDQREKIGRDEKHNVKKSLAREVSRDQSLTIGEDQTIRVGVDDSLIVDRDRTKVVAGSENVRVKEMLSLQVSGNDREKVGAVRRTLAGGIQKPDLKGILPDLKKLKKDLVPDPKAIVNKAKGALEGAISGGGSPASALSAIKGALPNPAQTLKSAIPNPKDIASKLKAKLDPASLLTGRIERTAKNVFSRVVGGAHVMLAGGNITRRASYLLAETIGFVKLSRAADENVMLSVSGTLLRSVLGSVTRKAGTDVGHSAETTNVSVAGKIAIDTDEDFDIKGETIKLTATESLTLTVGSLTLAMTPATITIHGNLKVDAKASLLVRGGPDDVTK